MSTSPAAPYKAVTALALALALVLTPPIGAAGAPSEVRVVGLEIRGNKNVASDKVLAIIRIHVGDTLGEDKLEKKARDEDLKAIAETGLFADQAIRLVPAKGGVKVIYELVENPRVRAISLKGNSFLGTKELVASMKTKPGQVLNTNSLRADLDRILKLYASRGGKARIADIVTSKDDRLTVTIAESRIEKIVIEGNLRTKESVIRREMLSKAHDLLSYTKIRTEQRRILNLGFFEEITPILVKGSTEDLTVYRLSLKERRTGGASGGLGVSGKDGLLGYFEVAERNGFGKGQRYSIRFELGSNETRTYELGFVEPWLGPSRTSLGASLYDRQVVRRDGPAASAGPAAYSERRTGGEIVLSRPIDKAAKVSLKARVEHTATSPPRATSQARPGDGSTRSLSIGYSRDTRDSIVNPSKGNQASLSAELAGGLLGGDNTFQKLVASGCAYELVRPGSTVALRATLGKILCSDALPSQERFRIGGADSIRGYDYGSLQGDSMAFANLEYRFPVANLVSGVLFADIGDAWYGAEDGAQMRLGLGAGVRFDTVIGLVGVDYGVGRGPDGGLQGRAVLGMGQTF